MGVPVKKNGKTKKVEVKTTGTSTRKGTTIKSGVNSPNAKLQKQLGAVPDNWRGGKPKSKLTIRERHQLQVTKDRGSVKSGKVGKR